MIKRITFVFFLTVILSLSLSACDSVQSEEPEPVTTETSSVIEATETQMPTAISPTETLLPPTETPLPTETQAPAVEERKVMVGDLERSYLLYIPPDLTEEQAVPVVFAFHGYLQSPEIMQEDTGFNKVADRNDFIVIYPAGEGVSWNSGEVGPGFAIETGVDDIAFVESILSELESIVNIDLKRIYAVGFSMGGLFSYRLACDMSDTFAAIASVSGPMMYSACEPTRAVSVMHIHGKADIFVPFSGGGQLDAAPSEEGIESWVAFNGCTDSQVRENEKRGYTQTVYSSCQPGISVELYLVEGMDHVWPDMANKTIWMFFSRHLMP